MCIPIFAEKDQIVGSQTLSFIKSMKEIPAAGLVEPLKKDALWEAIPAVYQKQGHIAVLNLGPTVTISKGTQIGTVTPVHMDKQKEKI